MLKHLRELLFGKGCEHEREKVKEGKVYNSWENPETNLPIGYKRTYVCKKCVKSNIVKNY